jgi:hypothetical protein
MDKNEDDDNDGKRRVTKIPNLLTIREVAELLAVTERHIRRLVHATNPVREVGTPGPL